MLLILLALFSSVRAACSSKDVPASGNNAIPLLDNYHNNVSVDITYTVDLACRYYALNHSNERFDSYNVAKNTHLLAYQTALRAFYPRCRIDLDWMRYRRQLSASPYNIIEDKETGGFGYLSGHEKPLVWVALDRGKPSASPTLPFFVHSFLPSLTQLHAFNARMGDAHFQQFRPLAASWSSSAAVLRRIFNRAIAMASTARSQNPHGYAASLWANLSPFLKNLAFDSFNYSDSDYVSIAPEFVPFQTDSPLMVAIPPSDIPGCMQPPFEALHFPRSGAVIAHFEEERKATVAFFELTPKAIELMRICSESIQCENDEKVAGIGEDRLGLKQNKQFLEAVGALPTAVFH